MKRLLSIGMVLMLIGSAIGAGTWVGDDVRGTYWNGEKTAKIRVYRAVNGKYYGKIEHLVEPNDENGQPKKDPNNPDPEKRERDRLGMLIMNSFEWNEAEQQWENGTIYDPNNGKTYDGFMKFKNGDNSVLYLRGYVLGMKWLGRTSEWERIE